MTTNKHRARSIINLILHTISRSVNTTATVVMRLFAGLCRLFDDGRVVVNVRPHKCDIHLNSSAAIRIYLAMLDRPRNPSGIDLNTTNDWFSTYQDVGLDCSLHSDTQAEHPVGSLGRVIDDCLVDTIRTHSDVTPSPTHAGGEVGRI